MDSTDNKPEIESTSENNTETVNEKDEKPKEIKKEKSLDSVDLKNDNNLWDRYKWILLLVMLVAFGYFAYIYFFQDYSPFKSNTMEFGSTSNMKPNEPFFDSRNLTESISSASH